MSSELLLISGAGNGQAVKTENWVGWGCGRSDPGACVKLGKFGYFMLVCIFCLLKNTVIKL